MLLPAHLAPRKGKRKSKSVEKDKKKHLEKEEEKTQPDGTNPTQDHEPASNKPSNNSNPDYPGKKKKRNSDGYGYGYKKSATSDTSKMKDSQTQLFNELALEDRKITKDLGRKSLVSTSIGLLVALLIIWSCMSLYEELEDRWYKAKFRWADDMIFLPTSPSSTHYRFSIVTDDLDYTRLIMEVVLNLDPKKSAEPFQRNAAILFSFYFKHITEKSINNKPPLINVTEAPPGRMVSLLAWGFNKDAKSMSMGSFIIRNENITKDEFGKILHFPSLGNTSLFGTPKNLDTMYVGLFDRLSGTHDNDWKPSRDVLLNDVVSAYQVQIMTAGEQYSNATNVSKTLFSHRFHDFEQHGLLHFISSGPKTLGFIAELAIQAALEFLDKKYRDPAVGQVDGVVAQTLIATLDTVAGSKDYFKNFTQNNTYNHKGLEKYKRSVIEDLRKQLHHRMDRKRSLVKFNTSGAVTSNLMMLDSREGWPSIMHYSISAPGPFTLKYLNKTSYEMLNTCQIMVVKDGFPWLTAAASGEFYLLEKVVSSMVHKIARDADPLGDVMERADRLRYDVHERKLTREPYSDNYPKESLQFSKYHPHYDRFRTWVEETSKITDTDWKWNSATGF